MSEETIGIVTGFPRSGTSSMMRALGASTPYRIWSERVRDGMNRAYGDERYRPNANGFFELSARTQERFFCPGGAYEHAGRLIKIMATQIARLSVFKPGYRILMMARDPDEIRESFKAFFHPSTPIERVPSTSRHPCPAGERYWQMLSIIKEGLDNRIDVPGDVTVFNYANVCDEPEKAFGILKEKGWPVDVDKAAALVDASLRRFRLEECTSKKSRTA